MFYSILLLGYLSLAAASTATTYPLVHRFLSHPPAPVEAKWAPFGSISLTQPAGTSGLVGAFEPAPAGNEVPEGQPAPGSGWYQLALDLQDGSQLLTSVRACHLPVSSNETIVLGLSSASGGARPTSLHLDLGAGVDPQGACPRDGGGRVSSGRSVQVELRTPLAPNGITLAPPPALNPGTGKPAEPEVEKSFFQKYWLAILGVGLFAITQMAPEPPQQGARPAAK